MWFAAVLFLASAGARADGVFAQPPHLYLSAAAGTILEERLVVSTTAEVTQARLSISPFMIDERGVPRSCRCRSERGLDLWSALSADRLTLRGGAAQEVKIRVSIPLDAVGSYWGAVLIDIAPKGLAGGVRARLAIPIVVTASGTETPGAAIRDVRAVRGATGDVLVSGVVENRGNTVVHAPLVAAIEAPSNNGPIELATLEDAVITVLPGATQRFQLRVVGRFDKSLRATVWLRYAAGSNAIAEASCDVEAPCETHCAAV